MRTLFALALLSLALAGCELDEGINVHDVEGTVLVPKSVAPTADSVGMIYVGLYSGIDNHLGFPSPIAAPAASTAGADTFPYGGTSIGVFTTRDARTICAVVSGRTIRDGGANWELDFEILQFPFYEGTSAWAFMDVATVDTAGNVTNPFGSCDRNGGYYGYYQVRVRPEDAVADGTQWQVFFADNGLALPDDSSPDRIVGGAGERRYLDAAGQYWQVTDVDGPTNSIHVFDLYDYGGAPAKNGPTDPIIYTEAARTYFGSQFQNVLNFPGDYINDGDYVVQTPQILDRIEKIELTIDYEVDR